MCVCRGQTLLTQLSIFVVVREDKEKEQIEKRRGRERERYRERKRGRKERDKEIMRGREKGCSANIHTES